MGFRVEGHDDGAESPGEVAVRQESQWENPVTPVFSACGGASAAIRAEGTAGVVTSGHDAGAGAAEEWCLTVQPERTGPTSARLTRRHYDAPLLYPYAARRGERRPGGGAADRRRPGAVGLGLRAQHGAGPARVPADLLPPGQRVRAPQRRHRDRPVDDP